MQPSNDAGQEDDDLPATSSFILPPKSAHPAPGGYGETAPGGQRVVAPSAYAVDLLQALRLEPLPPASFQQQQRHHAVRHSYSGVPTHGWAPPGPHQPNPAYPYPQAHPPSGQPGNPPNQAPSWLGPPLSQYHDGAPRAHIQERVATPPLHPSLSPNSLTKSASFPPHSTTHHYHGTGPWPASPSQYTEHSMHARSAWVDPPPAGHQPYAYPSSPSRSSHPHTLHQHALHTPPTSPRPHPSARSSGPPASQPAADHPPPSRQPSPTHNHVSHHHNHSHGDPTQPPSSPPHAPTPSDPTPSSPRAPSAPRMQPTHPHPPNPSHQPPQPSPSIPGTSSYITPATYHSSSDFPTTYYPTSPPPPSTLPTDALPAYPYYPPYPAYHTSAHPYYMTTEPPTFPTHPNAYPPSDPPPTAAQPPDRRIIWQDRPTSTAQTLVAAQPLPATRPGPPDTGVGGGMQAPPTQASEPLRPPLEGSIKRQASTEGPAEVAHWRGRCTQLEEANAQLRQRVEELARQLPLQLDAERQKWDEQGAALAAAEKKLRSLEDQLGVERRQGGAALDQVRALQEELRREREAGHLLRDEVASLQDRVKDLDRELDRSGRKMGEVAQEGRRVEAEVVALRRERQEVGAALQRAQGEMADLRVRLRAAEAEAGQARQAAAERQAASVQVATLQAKLADTEGRAETLETSVAMSRQEAVNLRQQVASLRSALATSASGAPPPAGRPSMAAASSSQDPLRYRFLSDSNWAPPPGSLPPDPIRGPRPHQPPLPDPWHQELQQQYQRTQPYYPPGSEYQPHGRQVPAVWGPGSRPPPVSGATDDSYSYATPTPTSSSWPHPTTTGGPPPAAPQYDPGASMRYSFAPASGTQDPAARAWYPGSRPESAGQAPSSQGLPPYQRWPANADAGAQQPPPQGSHHHHQQQQQQQREHQQAAPSPRDEVQQYRDMLQQELDRQYAEARPRGYGEAGARGYSEGEAVAGGLPAERSRAFDGGGNSFTHGPPPEAAATGTTSPHRHRQPGGTPIITPDTPPPPQRTPQKFAPPLRAGGSPEGNPAAGSSDGPPLVSSSHSSHTSPFGTDLTLKEMMARSAAMEEALMKLSQERSVLEAEFSRMPQGNGRSLAQKQRKAQVEARLEAISQQTSALRFQIKRIAGR